ncbi:glycosyltransferase involved in cell wall biosynthesis [Dysgonomonas sp. PH5-45]|uniref:glycosyltransferase n=1 Tax=unclassified Dysgonomonas TaxID=2630389 RepID=UPI0024759253|nr:MULTISPECIES: glycosyltransferase [unclassified Dysgonomonas]MDH6354097.1 glycosyltransferase involved in cell wall biosynthesis [Dysgonomonas sp. PH5-45]MDH6387052.1 glycosyltransferase involved in cell wall biosynthesis [Dysgonomonas sp. PH5-37]
MISVIISFYKRLDNLEMILRRLSMQSEKDFEVIVSEDDNAQTTIDYLKDARKRFDFTIKHISQEDKGFRKNKALNQSIKISEGEYLVFLDGDCIPHIEWLKGYKKWLKPKTVCLGRRCYLDEAITNRIYETKGKRIPFYYVLLHTKRLTNAFYLPFLDPGKPKRKIIGCNWGVHKQSLIDINGFDEDYEVASVGEDMDVDYRFRHTDVIFKNIKHSVVTLHLWHKANYKPEDVKKAKAIWAKKKEEGLVFCKNGLIKNKDN